MKRLAGRRCTRRNKLEREGREGERDGEGRMRNWNGRMGLELRSSLRN